MKKMTHIGIIKGCDKRTSDDFELKTYFRETKLYWISKAGIKYSKKKNGLTLGAWPMYYLTLKTIKPFEKEL